MVSPPVKKKRCGSIVMVVLSSLSSHFVPHPHHRETVSTLPCVSDTHQSSSRMLRRSSLSVWTRPSIRQLEFPQYPVVFYFFDSQNLYDHCISNSFFPQSTLKSLTAFQDS